MTTDLVARLFREIARGEIGGPSGTREMLALLSRDVNPAKPFEDLELEDARLAGQRLPAGTRFWSKSGDAYDVHHLVARAGRWYLVGWEPAREDWRIYRADRMKPRVPNGPRFTPREVPGGDVVT